MRSARCPESRHRSLASISQHHGTSNTKLGRERLRTVYDDSLLEAGICRIADEEEDIHEADEADLPRPSLTVDQDFPWVDVAVRNV